jgi:hypothetical protein
MALMRKRTFLGLVLAAMSGGCTAPDRWAHEGDSGYAWNYVQAPAMPQIDSLVAGDRKIAVHFTGSASHFIAICSVASANTGRNGNTFKSPATVDSLLNGVEHKCNVTAFNGSRPSPTSPYLMATPKAP